MKPLTRACGGSGIVCVCLPRGGEGGPMRIPACTGGAKYQPNSVRGQNPTVCLAGRCQVRTAVPQWAGLPVAPDFLPTSTLLTRLVHWIEPQRSGGTYSAETGEGRADSVPRESSSSWVRAKLRLSPPNGILRRGLLPHVAEGYVFWPLRRLPLHHVSLEAALIACVSSPRTLASPQAALSLEA